MHVRRWKNKTTTKETSQKHTSDVCSHCRRTIVQNNTKNTRRHRNQYGMKRMRNVFLQLCLYSWWIYLFILPNALHLKFLVQFFLLYSQLIHLNECGFREEFYLFLELQLAVTDICVTLRKSRGRAHRVLFNFPKLTLACPNSNLDESSKGGLGSEAVESCFTCNRKVQLWPHSINGLFVSFALKKSYFRNGNFKWIDFFWSDTSYYDFEKINKKFKPVHRDKNTKN